MMHLKLRWGIDEDVESDFEVHQSQRMFTVMLNQTPIQQLAKKANLQNWSIVEK